MSEETFNVKLCNDGDVFLEITRDRGGVGVYVKKTTARTIGQALLAAAGGESEKTCATCRFIGQASDYVFYCQAGCLVGRIPDPSNFGCIHWQPAPACNDGEGEQE